MTYRELYEKIGKMEEWQKDKEVVCHNEYDRFSSGGEDLRFVKVCGEANYPVISDTSLEYYLSQKS